MHLTKLAATYEDKPAVVMGSSSRSLSYRELERRSNQLARVFRARGLEPGDHIAILMENQLDLFPVVWAAQRSGLIYTPVNWHLSEDEAAYIVENCAARLLMYATSLEKLARAAKATSAVLESCLAIGDSDEGADQLENVLATMSTDPHTGEVEGYYMFYSSGTTGRPKGILPELTGKPFGTGLAVDHMMATGFGFGPETVYLSAGPLYHAAPLGWSLGAIRNGGTVVVMEKFDAALALALIERHQITHAQFVPTMFVRMLKLPDEARLSYDVSSLRVVVHAAAPCPVEVKERMIDWFGPKLVEFYAGSEGNGFFMIDTPSWLEHKGSVGQAVQGTVHICDDDGVELGPHEVGTVWMSGTTRFQYHGDPDKTKRAYDDRGWSTLGDMGHIDEDGFLYLSDRRTDLILSGGVNIYPREIEDSLILHSSVRDVAIIGLPDDEMGQRVHAVVEISEADTAGSELENELITFCREKLAHYKTPRRVHFGQVPRLPSGKILRRELRQRYEPG